MAQHENLFPTIREVAEQADRLPDDDEQQGSDKEKEALANDEERPLQEIESLCMKCGEQGVTRLLLTSIPFFREVIVMSFRCDHCGAQNNEIQSAGTIRPEGMVYTARILARSDLDRQLVRSATAEIFIPEFELTLPPTNRGQLSTIEGLIRDVVADLSMDQTLRRVQDEESYHKIQTLIVKLKEILADDDSDDEGDDDRQRSEVQVGQASRKDIPMPAFTIKLDDPAGNSFIEFVDSMADPKWNMRTYPRTLEHNIALGLVAPDDVQQANRETRDVTRLAQTEPEAIGNEEVLVFPGVCSSCGHPLETRMKKVIIPYFKDILIMSTNCDRCGYRDNEVKSGSAISPQGKRIILKVEDREDLGRDILKSETSGLQIPEIDLILQHGTLGGRFTTLEGILDQIYDELSEKVFASGDSSADQDRIAFEKFLLGLKEVKNVERSFTIILDDPLANSYVQNLYAPDPDPNMTIEVYDRTWEQNEELGLNDIKVEGYEQDGEQKDDEEAEADRDKSGPKQKAAET